MNTCADFQLMASEYIDDQLENGGTSQLFFHLGECRECRDFMKSLLRLRSAIQETILTKPVRQTSEKKPVWRREFSVSYAAAAVIGFIMLVSGAVVFQRIAQLPIRIEKNQTEYVYLTPFAPVYAIDEINAKITPKN
ncbi:MAG: hypothetical protein NTV54_14890 [Ignavibacteriales bacterium]|nr:hypothetical protein [Ignavibacteriales bacterium]